MYDHDKMRLTRQNDQKSTYVFRICIGDCCPSATYFEKRTGRHCFDPAV